MHRSGTLELLHSDGLRDAIEHVAEGIADDANGGALGYHVEMETDRVGHSAKVGVAAEDEARFLAIEFGTHDTPPHPRLRPAATKHR